MLAIATTIAIAIAVIAIAANAGPAVVATDAAVDTDVIDAIAANAEAAAIVVAHDAVATDAIASRACSAAADVPMDACAAVSDGAADDVMSFARPVASSVAVPRTSDEVRRLRADSDVLDILCAGDIDLAISKLPPSEADVMESQFVQRPSLNLSGGLRCGVHLMLFTEWILCSPSFRDCEINSTINWESSPSLRNVGIDSPSFRDVGIDSTINMDMGYGSSVAVDNEIIFSECVDAAALKALLFRNAEINSIINSGFSPSGTDN